MLDVVVVGAGLCGLAVAHSLQARRLNWALYEARPRVGGRVLSAHAASNGACLDLGPTWFWPQTQPRITRLVADLGLAVLDQHDDDTALSYDDVNATPRTVRTDRLHGGGKRLVGGMETLTEALAGRLPATRVHLRHELTAVHDGGDHVVLSFVIDGDAARPLTVQARHVVLAAPPRVLHERVRFLPELDEPVRQALCSLPTWMATAAKVACAYPTAFWREAGHSGNAFVSHHQAVLAEVFDACGAGGAPAALAAFHALDPAQRQAFKASLELLARNQLAQLFGPQADAGELFQHDWAREPLTCSELDLQDPAFEHPAYGDARLTQPLWQGRLWLAGSETAAASGGYLEGALAAAGRVRQGLDELRATRPGPDPAMATGAPMQVIRGGAARNDASLEQFAAWVADERSQALQRYKERLHRELSQQRVDQLTQRSVLEVAEGLYQQALARLATLPFERQGLAVEQGRSILTPQALAPFVGFTDDFLAEAVQFNRTSCALSNFPFEARPAWDYVTAIRRDLAAAWRDFALSVNDLLLPEGQTSPA